MLTNYKVQGNLGRPLKKKILELSHTTVSMKYPKTDILRKDTLPFLKEVNPSINSILEVLGTVNKWEMA